MGQQCHQIMKLADHLGHGGSVVGFGALRLEGRTFDSHSSHHVGTLGKSFTYSCLWHFGVLTPTASTM